MKNYMNDLRKVGVVAEKIAKRLEQELNEKIGLEYSTNFISMKFMEEDMCSYAKIRMQYLVVPEDEIEEGVELYTELFARKYYEDVFETYEASSTEIFIHNLLVENDCYEVHTETGNVCFEGNDYLLEDITSFTYYPKFKSIKIETDLEICMIELDVDKMVTVDKDGE